MVTLNLMYFRRVFFRRKKFRTDQEFDGICILFYNFVSDERKWNRSWSGSQTGSPSTRFSTTATVTFMLLPGKVRHYPQWPRLNIRSSGIYVYFVFSQKYCFRILESQSRFRNANRTRRLSSSSRDSKSTWWFSLLLFFQINILKINNPKNNGCGFDRVLIEVTQLSGLRDENCTIGDRGFILTVWERFSHCCKTKYQQLLRIWWGYKFKDNPSQFFDRITWLKSTISSPNLNECWYLPHAVNRLLNVRSDKSRDRKKKPANTGEPRVLPALAQNRKRVCSVWCGPLWGQVNKHSLLKTMCFNLTFWFVSEKLISIIFKIVRKLSYANIENIKRLVLWERKHSGGTKKELLQGNPILAEHTVSSRMEIR